MRKLRGHGDPDLSGTSTVSGFKNAKPSEFKSGTHGHAREVNAQDRKDSIAGKHEFLSAKKRKNKAATKIQRAGQPIPPPKK